MDLTTILTYTIACIVITIILLQIEALLVTPKAAEAAAEAEVNPVRPYLPSN